MRNAFIDELILAAQSRENIVLVVGDLGYGVVEPFARQFPDRFFNAGVAEQNMMGICAGLASEGFHVFAYSIANFPTFRCAEQIRNDVDHHKLAVTVVAVGGGLAYGNLGYSHHAVQDYALMRVMPNMLIAAPGDPMEVSACMRYLINNPQPSYLRLGKAGEKSIHCAIPQVVPGAWLPVVIGENRNATFLTTGAPLQTIADWKETEMAVKDYSIFSMPLWGIRAKKNQARQVAPWNRVITVEDHLKDAGFGSWMLESLCENPALLSRISLMGLDCQVCGAVARQSTLNALGGLSIDHLPAVSPAPTF